MHVDVIWARYESYRSGTVVGTGYGLAAGNPFNNWRVSDRYADQCQFNQPSTQVHQQGAQQVRKLISKAQREGLLP